MANLIERPLIKKVTPMDPEHLVGDVIQSGHPLFGLVWINVERVSGAPCFYGTRVPIKTLFDSLAAGQTLDEYLDDFEGVSREEAEAFARIGQISPARRPSEAGRRRSDLSRYAGVRSEHSRLGQNRSPYAIKR